MVGSSAQAMPAPFNLDVETVDVLIEQLSAKERMLLWIVTALGGPVPLSMLSAAWPNLDAAAHSASGLLVRDGDLAVFPDLVARRAKAWMERNPGDRSDPIEDKAWSTCGAWYAAQLALPRARRHPTCSEAGRWAALILSTAQSLRRLRHFARGVVGVARDPALLGQILSDLDGAEPVAGAAPWKLYACLADALNLEGRTLLARSLYERAAGQAEAAEQWSDLIWICEEAVQAFRGPDDPDAAARILQRAVEAKRRAGHLRGSVLETELRAIGLRVGGRPAADALRHLEDRLAEARALWAGLADDPSATSPERWAAAQALVTGLVLARDANKALERWQLCLDLLAEAEGVERVSGFGEVALAERRWEGYPLLLKLGKLDEARRVLEGYVEIQHRAGRVTSEAWALVALAHVWRDLGDLRQAISAGLRALTVRGGLPEIRPRVLLHNNLAGYLMEAGFLDESGAHRLATLVYDELGAGSDLEKRQARIRLAAHVHELTTRGHTFTLPRLADILTYPAFGALAVFLAERHTDLGQLQSTLDRVVAAVARPTSEGQLPDYMASRKR